jgi:hypothetical protein
VFLMMYDLGLYIIFRRTSVFKGLNYVDEICLPIKINVDIKLRYLSANRLLDIAWNILMQW